MRAIRYSLHFELLIVAGFVFWQAKDSHLSARVAGFDFFHYGLMGVLHAMAVVLSLRDRKAADLIPALCFITLAAAWSAITPLLGLWGSVVWIPIGTTVLRPAPHNLIFVLATGSAIGSAGYWLLVRLFWLKSLRRADCFRTIALCATATLVSGLSANMLPRSLNTSGEEISFILTAAWWCAFSISLYWSERSGYANKTGLAMADAS